MSRPLYLNLRVHLPFVHEPSPAVLPSPSPWRLLPNGLNGPTTGSRVTIAMIHDRTPLFLWSWPPDDWVHQGNDSKRAWQ